VSVSKVFSVGTILLGAELFLLIDFRFGSHIVEDFEVP
jgi:hypothetical protein